MRPIYIVLTNTGTFLNKAIKSVTNAPYNHASIALDENLELLYSFGRKQPDNPFWAGFVREDFVKGTYSWYPNSTCAILRLYISEREYEKLVRLIHVFEKNHFNYQYNFIGLLGVPIKYPVEVKASYFCSQFVSEILKRSGCSLFAKPSSLVTPDDFRYHNKLEITYEGKIYDYPALRDQIQDYDPQVYKSFPFRKYMVQQIRTEIFHQMKRNERKYFFRDGFVKPKKIYIGQKINKVRGIMDVFDQIL
ncbi:hypothetical protein [Pontibacillus marinus]|uniref:Uncharacterized protein n=1 Tax=Pontibacillus marinus BH030004 = DSM 16465 TaxID=1385511 RepID=A0A0A5FXJ8_9BACI|nr:hypothetical protein [Pontibacillus marinus]KGX83520.1 hypothetical protein N783_02785 [Pontibacillus marinus BH030004 = DSM 16465]